MTKGCFWTSRLYIYISCILNLFWVYFDHSVVSTLKEVSMKGFNYQVLSKSKMQYIICILPPFWCIMSYYGNIRGIFHQALTRVIHYGHWRNTIFFHPHKSSVLREIPIAVSKCFVHFMKTGTFLTIPTPHITWMQVSSQVPGATEKDKPGLA